MTDIKELQSIARDFIDKRDWRKFQTLKDLAMNSSIESNELMEIFLWHDENFENDLISRNDEEILRKIKNEVSDILFSCLAIADHLNFDISEAYKHKMSELDKRYDVNTVKGKLTKIPSPDHKKY